MYLKAMLKLPPPKPVQGIEAVPCAAGGTAELGPVSGSENRDCLGSALG